MKQKNIYANDWLQIHPYTTLQPSDIYFVELANRLFHACTTTGLPEALCKKLALYASAYLEDQISGLQLWQSFTGEHQRLYGTMLPFYTIDASYYPDEINEEDLRFLIWNTWQKAGIISSYLNPEDTRITNLAQSFYSILDKAYEEAPENPVLKNYFASFDSETDADRKLTWLFGHTYLTEPSMYPYINHVAPNDRFIMPTGPLALFLHEWISILSDNTDWKACLLYTSDAADE